METTLLQRKSKAFALRVIKLALTLQADKKEFILSRQVMRSGTSIGAQIHEAKFAESTADYVHKFKIALKEASETMYWIELIHESDFKTEEEVKHVIDDLNQLTGILVNSVKKLKEPKTPG